MKGLKNENKICKRVRKEVPEGSTTSRMFHCPQSDMNVVLRDWEKIRANYKKVSVDVFKNLLIEHPVYKTLFPSFAQVSFDDLENNKQFLVHAYAVIKGLNFLMNDLTGRYEDENEILSIIGYTHQMRGITREMMTHLRDSLLFIFSAFLKSSTTEKASWKTFLKCVFDDYLFKYMLRREDENEDEIEAKAQVKKLLDGVKFDCQNSKPEINELDEKLKKEDLKETNLQVITPAHLPNKQSIIMITTSPVLNDRRPSKSLLHPDHAKFMTQRRSSLLTSPLERQTLPFEDSPRALQNGGLITSPLSSSAASSLTSISNGPALGSHASDSLHNYESRRSSTMTNKYSLLDALDLEYELIKAAARGSIGPYSLSQSLQKLTFTQSLAFPALARGISKKKNPSQSDARGPLNPIESGVNAFAKVATVLILMLISVLVFGVLYKFIRT